MLNTGNCTQLSSLEGVQGCSTLQQLDISRNPVTSLQALSALSQLTKLDMQYCEQLLSLEGLQGCSRLQELNISSFPLSILPEPLSALRMLRQVYALDCNEIFRSAVSELLRQLRMRRSQSWHR